MKMQVKMSEYLEDILNDMYETEDLSGVPEEIIELLTEAQHENDVIDGPPLTKSDVTMIIAASEIGDEKAIYARAPRAKRKSPFSKEGMEESREITKEELRAELIPEVTKEVTKQVKKAMGMDTSTDEKPKRTRRTRKKDDAPQTELEGTE